jgi:hypothetical protein
VTNARGDLLKPVALFALLGPEAMRDVSEAARAKQMEAGDLFFREGDPAESFYVVQTGSVKLTQLTPEGHQVVMRLIGAGNGTIRTAHPCELFGDDWLEWSRSRRDGQMLEPVQQPFLALSQDVLACSKT